MGGDSERGQKLTLCVRARCVRASVNVCACVCVRELHIILQTSSRATLLHGLWTSPQCYHLDSTTARPPGNSLFGQEDNYEASGSQTGLLSLLPAYPCCSPFYPLLISFYSLAVLSHASPPLIYTLSPISPSSPLMAVPVTLLQYRAAI